jgi:hypothetical protein
VAGPIKDKLKIFFLLIRVPVLFKGTFTSVFIDKKSKESHKIVEIKVFLTFLLDPPNKIMIYQDPGGPKTYGSTT